MRRPITGPGPSVIAVDWSGRDGPRQAESIWVAEVLEARLVALRNGRRREEVVEHLAGHRDVVVGLDFAFSVPAWWARRCGAADVRDVWRHLGKEADALIERKPWPFWGAAGSVALPAAQRFRRTEELLRDEGFPAKSVFQLAGAGAVGVGSLRGMPCLLELTEAHGFGVWPFDPPSPRRALEIYPRALTGRVDKGRWASRHDYLERRFAGQDPVLLERAAGSEDAFDAAVSALVMGAHASEIAALPQATGVNELLEGRIWTPA